MNNFIDNIIFTASIGIIIGVLCAPVQAGDMVYCKKIGDIGPGSKVQAFQGRQCPPGWMPA